MLPCVCGALALDDLVDGDVGLAAVHGPQGEAALLQLGLRVIPVLVKQTTKYKLNRNRHKDNNFVAPDSI